MLAFCRYLALIYGIGLALGETILNASQEHWQFAPLWIIDYLIAIYLLIGFRASRHGRNVPILMSAYALSTGVLYLAFFLHIDPSSPAQESGPVVVLMGVCLGASVVGLAGSTLGWYSAKQDHQA